MAKLVERYEVTSVGGLAIPVWKSGSGPPVLLVHGGTGSHAAMEPLRPHLEERMSVATMDRRAFLEDPFLPLSYEAEIADIVAVAESLGNAVDVFGHSAGALALIGAAPRMGNLRKLVLYEPPFPPPADQAPSADQVAFAEQMRSLLEADDADDIFEAWFATASAILPDPEAWLAARDQLAPFSRSLVRELQADRSMIGPNSLDGLSMPTLYLVGEKTFAEYSRAWIPCLQAGLPDFQVREIPGHGHLANFHAPALLAGMMLEFLLDS